MQEPVEDLALAEVGVETVIRMVLLYRGTVVWEPVAVAPQPVGTAHY
jgi:hypothetical protein